MTDQINSEDEYFSQLIIAIKSGSLQQAEGILRVASPDIVNRIEPQFREPSLYFAALAPEDEQSAQLIKMLIRNGANVGFKDHNEQTILFYICREGKEKCVELLLSHGLSLDDLDVYGQTPLFYAVSENRLEIVSKYATKERVNQVDNLTKQTPIYYAVRKGHLEMSKLLIEKGADLTITDSSKKSVAQYAKRAKFTQLAEYLTTEIKKVKQLNKSNNLSEESEKKASGKRKEESVKDAKQAYKIVFLNEKGQTHSLTEDEVRQLIADRPQLGGYIGNPESIPPEGLTAVESESWQKVATKILNLCSKLKGAYYFMEPVDPVKFNIMDYFDIITNPMDLGTVRKKLTHNCYPDPAHFVQDMNLIWTNSVRYNGDHHIISKCGKELEAAFNELVQSQGLDKYLKTQ